jgi:hypothetical protein
LVGYSKVISESGMALFFERLGSCAQKVMDSARIVSEAIFHQPPF